LKEIPPTQFGGKLCPSTKVGTFKSYKKVAFGCFVNHMLYREKSIKIPRNHAPNEDTYNLVNKK
jgi:hypothetical protein